MKQLAYIGDGRFTHGIPDTDLSADDIAALAEAKGKKPAELTKELVESGLYKAKAEKE